MQTDKRKVGFDPKAIDELLHHPTRLAITTALSQVETGDFTWLKEITKTTDGNLATHLRKLEEGGYLVVKKTFVGRKPASFYKLTIKGKTALMNYLKALSAIVKEFGENQAP